MKQTTLAHGALIALIALLAFAGCASEQVAKVPEEPAAEEEAAMDEFVSTAMVVTFGDGEVLFVDQDTESPYYPTLPEGTPELAAGNIVRVTGNGIMLESYPAQYPGITDVEVVEEGTPADAEKYDELVAQIWQPKDPSEPPLASLEYTTELAATSVMLGTYGYTWSYEENGSEQTVTADAPHPTQLEAAELPDARVDDPPLTCPARPPASFAGPRTSSKRRRRRRGLPRRSRSAASRETPGPSTTARSWMAASSLPWSRAGATPSRHTSTAARPPTPSPCDDPKGVCPLLDHSSSSSASQRSEQASDGMRRDGMRRSPRGLTAAEPTLGPSGRQLRLNCCAK